MVVHRILIHSLVTMVVPCIRLNSLLTMVVPCIRLNSLLTMVVRRIRLVTMVVRRILLRLTMVRRILMVTMTPHPTHSQIRNTSNPPPSTTTTPLLQPTVLIQPPMLHSTRSKLNHRNNSPLRLPKVLRACRTPLALAIFLQHLPAIYANLLNHQQGLALLLLWPMLHRKSWTSNDQPLLLTAMYTKLLSLQPRPSL